MPYRRGYKRERSVPLIRMGACGFSQEFAQRISCVKNAPWLAAEGFPVVKVLGKCVCVAAYNPQCTGVIKGKMESTG
jgi:hypothetical protein